MTSQTAAHRPTGAPESGHEWEAMPCTASAKSVPGRKKRSRPALADVKLPGSHTKKRPLHRRHPPSNIGKLLF